MPGLDRTGPQGRGSRTGGGFGLCNGITLPREAIMWPRGRENLGVERRAPGTGGRGRGRMNRFFATGIPGYEWLGRSLEEQNKQKLEQEAKVLEQQLDEVKKRIESLDD
ncbi:MAG: DUF5320 domain-containing protein [Candidatus Altiarchaeota archaeon]